MRRFFENYYKYYEKFYDITEIYSEEAVTIQQPEETGKYLETIMN